MKETVAVVASANVWSPVNPMAGTAIPPMAAQRVAMPYAIRARLPQPAVWIAGARPDMRAVQILASKNHRHVGTIAVSWARQQTPAVRIAVARPDTRVADGVARKIQ